MRFLPLVENEVLKLLKRRRFRVVLLILVALIGLIVYAQIKGRERFLGKENWRVRVQERIARMQNQVRSGRMPRTAERWTRFEMARLQYHVDRNVDPDAISGPLFVRLFANASSYLLLPLLALVFGSDIVSSEFSQGTIKLGGEHGGPGDRPRQEELDCALRELGGHDVRAEDQGEQRQEQIARSVREEA